MVDFGTGWGTPNGQDLSMPAYMASGNQIVAEAILRRFTTPRGNLIDDPNYGLDILDLISDDLSPRDIAYYQQQLSVEAAKDERVFKAQFSLVVTGSGSDAMITVSGVVLTAKGSFKLVLTASAVSVQLLLVSP